MESKDTKLKEQILSMIAMGREPKELAKEYDIPRQTITNWRRSSKDPKVKPKVSEETLKIRTLEKEIQDLKMERDILKKAMAIVSKN